MSAGHEVGEKMWMLPFDKEVRELLDSDIADMKNADGREGSAIQGGMFLQEFSGKQPWVHLDIAGTSYLDKPRAYEPKGGTGVAHTHAGGVSAAAIDRVSISGTDIETPG